MRKEPLKAVSVLALTAALLLGGQGMSYAFDGPPPPPPHKYCPASELSPEQLKSYKELHDAFIAASLPLRQQDIIKKAELKAEMMSPAPNTEKVLRLHKELGELKGKLAVVRIKFKAECLAKGLPPLPKHPDRKGPHHGPGKDQLR